MVKLTGAIVPKAHLLQVNHANGMTAMLNEDAVASLSVTTEEVDREMLSQLLAAACVAVDSDRDAAKGYIRQAEGLLQVCRKERQPPPASAHAFFRGGLAAWQRRRVAAYVQANISSNINVADLARLVRLSKGHFFRAFRESFGEPPGTYVARQRMLRGQALMLNSQASLSEIALACGMCDQPHFTRVFSRLMGESPSAWRRRFAFDPASRSAV